MPVLPVLLRASHPEPAAAVTAVSVALAASAGRSAPGVVATGAAILAGQLSVGWCNDVVDAERDRATGRTDKPVATGEISASVVWRAAVVSVTAAVLLSLLSGWRATIAHTLAIALAWAYNLGLKSTPFSVVPYAIAFALLPTFVALGLPGAPTPPWWAPVAGGLLGAGAHFANVLPDLDDDLATGVRGLPHRLGPTASRLLAAGLLLAATVVLVFGPGRATAAGVIGLVVVAGLVVAGLVLQRRPGSRAAFRMTMIVALFDVALLVARGRSLG